MERRSERRTQIKPEQETPEKEQNFVDEITQQQIEVAAKQITQPGGTKVEKVVFKED